MNKNQKSLVLYPSKLKSFVILSISLFFTVGGIWLASTGDPTGWLILIFFGFSSFVAVINFSHKRSYLRLSEKGFEVCSLSRSNLTKWDDVESFGTKYIGFFLLGGAKKVVFNYRKNSDSENVTLDMSKKMAKSISGFEGGLPNTYKKSAKDLAKILNEWRERYSSKQE